MWLSVRALVVADERDGISVWNYRAGEKACHFSNTNPAGSRVTSLGWMNEGTDPLLFVGSDDGVVRVWGSIQDDGVVGGGGFGRWEKVPRTDWDAAN